MGTRVEKNGYTAELTDDLEIVYRNPQGRRLKNFPGPIAGAPGLDAQFEARRHLRKQREACRLQAREWALVGASVPRALADADPLWQEALETEHVELGDELGDGGLWARTYVGFDGLTLTQLLPEQLIPYRDRLMREEHWEPDGCFSTGIPDLSDGGLPFPERIIAAHPGLEELVTRKLLGLQGLTHRWSLVYKPDVDSELRGLEESAPALFITLLDEMADLALRLRERATAAAWFGRARTAERVQARKVDTEWLLGRYLAYADGEALSATVLRAWARELAVKGVATEADLARFRLVAIRRVQASSEVYPQLAVDVRKIAKAAGLDPERELATLLGEIIAADGISLHDDKFWTDCLKGAAMDLLGDHAPTAVDRVLKLRPRHFGEDPTLWRALLERTGALARLTGETEDLPAGAAAVWFSECVRRNSHHHGPSPVMYEIAELIAPRLAADGVPVTFRYRQFGDRGDAKTPLDLIDLLLEHGAPVADPPELLGPSQLYTLLLGRRPKLEHLRADERFARELRARVRADLEMTTENLASNSWYQPHETKGWQQIPDLFDNPIGYEEIRAWCDRERAKLRAGVDFEELVLLLGRFVHVGVAVDLLLKNADAAAEFAAVDVMTLLMAEMPDTVSRAQVEEALGKLQPYGVEREGVRGPNRGPILEALPQLGEPMNSLAARSVVMAVNCRAGLERLVRRLTPDAEDTKPTPEAGREAPYIQMARQMMRFAERDTAVWDGDLAQPSTRFDISVRHDLFHRAHANAAPLALCAVSSRPGGRAGQSLMTYTTHPVAAGEPGRWRVVYCEAPEDRTGAYAPTQGQVFRTATSVAVVVVSGGTKPHRVLWEYAPDGSFAEDGPLAPAGVELTRAHVLEPVRPAEWFARFVALYREHGPAPARPELAAALAERLGISPVEAAVLLMAHVPCAPHQLEEEDDYLSHHPFADLEAWKIRRSEADQAAAALTSALGSRFFTTFYDRLLPDDPELLWTTGPDVDRRVVAAGAGQPPAGPHRTAASRDQGDPPAQGRGRPRLVGAPGRALVAPPAASLSPGAPRDRGALPRPPPCGPGRGTPAARPAEDRRLDRLPHPCRRSAALRGRRGDLQASRGPGLGSRPAHPLLTAEQLPDGGASFHRGDHRSSGGDGGGRHDQRHASSTRGPRRAQGAGRSAAGHPGRLPRLRTALPVAAQHLRAARPRRPEAAAERRLRRARGTPRHRRRAPPGLGAGPHALRTASRRGVRQGLRTERGRRRALPDAARPAGPDGPQRQGVDRVEARPFQGGRGRTGRVGSSAASRQAASGPRPLPAWCLAGTETAAPPDRGGEARSAAAGQGTPVDVTHGRGALRPTAHAVHTGMGDAPPPRMTATR
ncbi:hypothetical protein ACFVZW_19155 [Streptomyces sp. NPDC059567]|uniref:hypothetical protein n=1 Tax=Streptomyces sp. NPDC059567 TaxID=3346867 RepID=UPI0036931646